MWDDQLKPLLPPPLLGLLPLTSRMFLAFQARTVTLETVLVGF